MASIGGQAASGHPSWATSGARPVPRPPRPPRPPGIASAGSAALGAPPPRGLSTAGTGILPPPPAGAYKLSTSAAGAPPKGVNRGPGAPASAGGTHAVTTTVTPPAPDLSGDQWKAYLTPDQLAGLIGAGATYTQNVGDWNAKIGDAQTNYGQQIGNINYAHDVHTAQANEEMAARGLSVSGIRDTDMTDINRTKLDQTATATQALNTLIGEATRAITALNAGWTATQIGYQGDAGANAAASAAAQPYQVTSQVPNAPPPPPPAPAPPPAAAPPPKGVNRGPGPPPKGVNRGSSRGVGRAGSALAGWR